MLSRKTKWKQDSFYYTPEWRALRRQVIKRYGRVCMCCKRMPQKHYDVHVDHIKPRSKYPELQLEFSNLQVLCKRCNTKKSDDNEIDYRPAYSGLTIPASNPSVKGHWTNGLTADEVMVAKRAIEAYRRAKQSA